MTDTESNIQAYKTMAEVLISFRKILLRGLCKVAGNTWYLDACPPGVYERLVERKEKELAIERLPSEYQELMSFATFDDLAEIIDYNDDLARLLHNLAPSKEVLCARFTELEALRAKLAMARSLNEDELSLLTSYSSHLRQTLAGARRRVHGTAGDEDEVTSAEEPVPSRPPESIMRAAAGPVPTVQPYRPPDRVEAEAADLTGEDAKEASRSHVTRDEAVASPGEPTYEQAPVDALEVEDLTEAVAAEQEPETAAVDDQPAEATTAVVEPPPDVGEAESGRPSDEADELLTEATDVETATVPTAPLITLDPEVLAEDMKGALEEADDLQVLRILRREIIAVAEAVFRGDDVIETRAWQLVQKKDWFERRHGDLGLEPLAEFYELVEGFEAAREQGGSEEELRDFLTTRNFSRLLLTLREVFLRSGV